MLHSSFKTILQYFLPHHALSRLAGVITNSQMPWLKDALIEWFIKQYGVDMRIALQPDPLQYPSFNSFFTRELQPAARPIASEEKAVICPVDGVISQLGHIHQDTLFQAKGFNYNVKQLLGGCSEQAALFQNGEFITFYLAPKDYHRVHMPLAGTLQTMRYVPGRLFSVNTTTVEEVPNLFARNERMVAIFNTTAGSMAIIMVGAMLVGSIHTTWAGQVAPLSRRPLLWQYENMPSIQLARAAQMGHFQLGSTVIVLFSPNRIQWAPDLQSGQAVQFGQSIATEV